MSRTAPLEVCARCEMFKPSAEMTNVYARDSQGQVVCLRLCRTCASPQLTYIQWSRPVWLTPDVGPVLTAALALILVVWNVVFGLLVGGVYGFTLALVAMLVGAGILASLAATSR